MKILAFDSSTETLSIAAGELRYSSVGSAKTSEIVLPVILNMMAELGWRFSELDAIAFGRGPGAFTGLRSACAIAQGLAFAHNIPVLPVDTLLAVAEEARFATGAEKVCATLDARMGEVYCALYDFSKLAALSPPFYVSPVLEKLTSFTPQVDFLWAGNLSLEILSSIQDKPGVQQFFALPSAHAMLRLAPALISKGLMVSAEEAAPLYIRDKVAQTVQERAAQRLSTQSLSI